MNQQSPNTAPALGRPPIWPPLSLFIFLNIVYGLSIAGILPSHTQLSSKLMTLFASGGVWILVLCALLESTIGINGYVPGAATIIFALASANGELGTILLYSCGVFAGTVFGNLLSYSAGRFSSNKVGAAANLTRKTVWLTYWHPQIASFTAFHAGRQRIRLPRFLKTIALASICWATFWTFVFSSTQVGKSLTGNFPIIFYTYVLIWLLGTYIRRRRFRTHGNSSGSTNSPPQNPAKIQ